MGRRGRHPDPNSKRSQVALARAKQLAKYAAAPAQAPADAADIDPPAQVTKVPEAIAFWSRNAPILQADGRLRAEQLDAFAILCRLHSDIVHLEDQVLAEGWITATDKGQAASPVAKLLRDSRRDFVTLAREFGLTAASSARLPQEAAGGQEEDRVDEEENLLRSLQIRQT